MTSGVEQNSEKYIDAIATPAAPRGEGFFAFRKIIYKHIANKEIKRK
jgi:hypothetical protein